MRRTEAPIPHLPLFSPKTKKSGRPVGFKKPQERRGLVRRREREKVLRR